MNEKKDIFVISDLHMGDSGPRDNFAVGDKEKQLDLFLDFVTKENGELIIVGDLFEFWQASLGKVLVKRRNLIDRLGDMGATFVVGNHDVDLEALIGSDILSHPFFRKMTVRFLRDIGKKKFMFMHGHEVDPYNKGDTPGWGRIAAIFAGIAEDKIGSPLLHEGLTSKKVLSKMPRRLAKALKWFMNLHLFSKRLTVETALLKVGSYFIAPVNWMKNQRYKKIIGGSLATPKRELTPAQNPGRAVEMLHLYKKDKIKEGYEIAIVGHTHKAGTFEDWYFNSGSWATGENNFLRISDDGKVGVFGWEDGKAIANGTVLSV